MAQAIRAHRRRFPELDQVQMQRAVCAFVTAGEQPLRAVGCLPLGFPTILLGLLHWGSTALQLYLSA